jgi:2-oxoglutarate dehydrogenase E2 component (dihydrolipoamide succinyltransferase)
MTTEIKVPVLPESVSDAVIAKWHKQPGDVVKQDELLVDIETDKVILEVTSPVNGVIDDLLFPITTVVKAQQVIGHISAAANIQDNPVPVVAATPVEEQLDVKKVDTQESMKQNVFSPAVRKLLRQHNLQGEDVIQFTGNDRLTVEDIERYLARNMPVTPVVSAAIQAKNSVSPVSTKELPVPSSERDQRGERRVPMSRMRLKIAERLVQAQHTAAMLTTFNEIDMQPIMNIRSRYKEEFEKKHQIKLGFMSFFIKACCHALERFPVVNACIDNEDILYHDYADIGVAVASQRGLVVPIIRDVQNLSLAQLETSVAMLAEKARLSTLTMDELTGGTFTITNGGVFGSLLSTPIINPPQTAILGMHKIEQRPVVVDNQIVIRPMMYVALSYDHRLIDGADAVQFLVTIKNLLQEPERLLLDL